MSAATTTTTMTATPVTAPAHAEVNDHVAPRACLNDRGTMLRSPLEVDDTGAMSAQPRTADKTMPFKLASAGFSFFAAGVNDGSLGALIPYVIRDYSITTAIVSALYAASFAGWLTAALTNTHLTQRLGLGTMLALGAMLQAAAQALRTWPPAPPFGVYVATFALTSLGQAYQDTHVNTFVAGSSSAAGAHRWLGFIHAAYMAGCLAGPFASSAIASTSGSASGSAEAAPSRWWLFYTVPLGLGLANLGLVFAAFRDSLHFRWRRQTDLSVPEDGGRETGDGPSATAMVRRTLSTPSVWLLSLFFFCYLGFGVTAGGWVVEYLVDVRNGDLAHVGYVPAGFSGGCLLGRIVLPEPTHRYGERRMVFLYCVCCLVFQLVFWLVPNIIAASVAISLLGFFSGPFFATAISVGSRLFPPDINATAISFVFVFAQVGGSLFPIVTGVLGSHLGVGVMQPVLVGLIVVTTVSWLLVPRPPKEKQ